MTPALHALLYAENPANTPTYRSQQFRLSIADDRRVLEELLRSRPGIRVCDTLLTQLRDLIRSHHPNRKIAPADLDSLAREHLGSTPMEEYGLWFYLESLELSPGGPSGLSALPRWGDPRCGTPHRRRPWPRKGKS
jgi:hypothetical protein